MLQEADDNRLKVKFLTDKTTFMRESIDALEDQNRVQASTIARQQDCINELQVGGGQRTGRLLKSFQVSLVSRCVCVGVVSVGVVVLVVVVSGRWTSSAAAWPCSTR